MKENKIDILILTDEENNLAAFKFSKMYTDSEGCLMMSLLKDNSFFQFKVVQTDQGLTELYSDTNMRYRIYFRDCL